MNVNHINALLRCFFQKGKALLIYSVLLILFLFNPAYASLIAPPQNLKSLMERHGHKPYERFHRQEEMLNHRIVFNDLDHGSELWMLDTSPIAEHSGTASIWPAWNADGSLLYLQGHRQFRNGISQSFINSDYSRLMPYVHGSRVLWDREDPDVYFFRPDGRLFTGSVSTGETRLLAEWDPYPRERSYGLTSDNQYIFIDTPNGGIWLPYEPGEKSIPHIQMHDGRPGGFNPEGKPVPPRFQIDEWMYRGSPRGKFVEEHDQWGPLILVRTGMLIDRNTGRIDHVIAPAAGETRYLETFMSDRIQWPEGPEWDKYRIHKSDNLNELFEIYRYYPILTHGHEAHSPDGEYLARDGGTTNLIRVRDVEILQSYRLSPDGSNYHLHWLKHPRFYIGWVRGWNLPRFTRSENANTVYQIFSDKTWQPVFNTNHLPNTYYAGGDFSMMSPDATKIHTASSMTGRFRNYIAVMARPRPPSQLEWETDGSSLVLNWEPSGYHRETRGYLVYRSMRSGDDYELLTHEPVMNTSWRDTAIEPGQDYYYVITSLEHSGLESGYSEEVSRAGVQLSGSIDQPLTIYLEAENAMWDRYTTEMPGLAVGRDVQGASDWYYVYKHPDVSYGESSLQVRLPEDETYYIWARIRDQESGHSGWILDLESTKMKVETDSQTWKWVLAGSTSLSVGALDMMISTEDPDAAMDVICFTTDKSFEPAGKRPEAKQPPPPPAALHAEHVDDRTLHLVWDASSDPSLSHYNVYASRERMEEPGQQYLIGSPTEPELIDWGLRAETTYYYAVTAVDRRRNESTPIFIEANTPVRRVPENRIELTFDDAERQGMFERSIAAGTKGLAYLVPEEPENNRVSWSIDIPDDDTYYLWLRYLQRGDGSRGNTVSQNIQVLLNGKELAIIGGGETDMNAPDELITPSNRLADELWTWNWPGEINLKGVNLPAGTHTLTLKDLNERVRYDMLLLTNEPSFLPHDGRFRQR